MVQFYLPNFEDLVDPDFDFLNEKPSIQRTDRFSHDLYAHEFFPTPMFDGMLMSKTVISPNLEKRIKATGGVHAFCRLDSAIPVMGDCGAFTYREQTIPPYTVEAAADYYQKLGFTYGVAVDHLIFSTMPVAERERRLRITIDNARNFLAYHQANGCTFLPVGIAQGWDPPSRRRAIEQLLQMGYKHLALGGVARSVDKEIKATLEAIGPVLPVGVEFHIFGVARLALIPDFIRHGVTSADSSAPIMRAFMGNSEDNYWTNDGARYIAIRIPEIGRSGPKKRGVDSAIDVLMKNDISFDEVKELEQTALRTLRAYHQQAAGFDETLDAVIAYDSLFGDARNHAAAYHRTLRERPWQRCGCAICERYGVEVIIFRGNNRNRRRGFHNAKVFYTQFRNEVVNCRQTIDRRISSPPVRAGQLPFHLPDV